MNMSLSRLNNLNYNTQIILLYVFLSMILDLVNLVFIIAWKDGGGEGRSCYNYQITIWRLFGGGGNDMYTRVI